MCLAVPAQLVSASGTRGVADVRGSRLPVSTLLLPDVVEGDWILVHAGFAIQKLAPQDAAEAFRALDELECATRAVQPGAKAGGP